MVLMGRLFYVSSQSREKDGKTYSSVTLADEENAYTVSVGTDSDIDLTSLTRFREYDCMFAYSTFKGDGFLKVLQMSPSNSIVPTVHTEESEKSADKSGKK